MTALEVDRWTGAGVTVRCVSQVAEEHIGPLWDIYLAAFGGLRTTAAARQVLWPEEFRAEMVDERIWKYVALDEHDDAVGLGTLTADLRTVPWISPEFYAARYPEAAARGSLYFVPFVCTDPRRTRAGVYALMFRALIARAAADQGVLAYDVCGFNEETLAFGRRMEDWQRRSGARVVEQVDRQNYYVADYRQDIQ